MNGEETQDRHDRPGIAVRACVRLIILYQKTLSHIIGRQCRFEPTCSHYGIEALRRHGLLKGSWLTTRRFLRCHPFARGGIDRVP